MNRAKLSLFIVFLLTVSASVVFGQTQKRQGRNANKKKEPASSSGKVIGNSYHQRALNYTENFWKSRMLSCGGNAWYTVTNNEVVKIKERSFPVYYEALKQGLSRADIENGLESVGIMYVLGLMNSNEGDYVEATTDWVFRSKLPVYKLVYRAGIPEIQQMDLLEFQKLQNPILQDAISKGTIVKNIPWRKPTSCDEPALIIERLNSPTRYENKLSPEYQRQADMFRKDAEAAAAYSANLNPPLKSGSFMRCIPPAVSQISWFSVFSITNKRYLLEIPLELNYKEASHSDPEGEAFPYKILADRYRVHGLNREFVTSNEPILSLDYQYSAQNAFWYPANKKVRLEIPTNCASVKSMIDALGSSK